MIAGVFYWIVNMSVSALLTGLVVLALRLTRLPRRVVVWLWCVPLLRMCVPVWPDLLRSLPGFVARVTGRVVPPITDLSLSMLNYVGAASRYFPVAFASGRLATAFTVGGVVWLAGCVLTLAVFAAGYVRGMRIASRAEPDGNGVFRSNRVDGPAVFGIFRPRIVLPVDFPANAFVLAHERAHIRRRDNLRRLLAAVVVSVHWFDPLAWVFLRAFCTDLELACDEQVVSRLDDAGRRAYASALVDAAETRSRLVSPFGGAGTRSRVTCVLTYRRLSAASLAMCVLFALAVAVCLLSNG